MGNDNSVRLQKFMADAGVASRRACEEFIEKGKVKVNGVVATIGTKIDPKKDEVLFRGEVIKDSKSRYTYLMLNKPCGYVTTMNDEKGRPCVADLISDVGVRVYPIGRLDLESEGLLLFTNDGELSNRLTHPKYHKPKVYHVKVPGEISAEEIDALSKPMEIDDYMTKPAKVSLVTRKQKFSVVSITLYEGRNRQIRKMCEKLGLEVLNLRRISIGDIKLGTLPEGKWQYLTKAQVESLKK